MCIAYGRNPNRHPSKLPKSRNYNFNAIKPKLTSKRGKKGKEHESGKTEHETNSQEMNQVKQSGNANSFEVSLIYGLNSSYSKGKMQTAKTRRDDNINLSKSKNSNFNATKTKLNNIK